MVKNKLLYIFSFLSILLGISSSSFAADCKISVGYHYEPPILWDDEGTKKLNGLDKEVVELIANKADCKVEWVFLPWARALDMVKSGDLIMNTNALATPARKEFSNMIAYRPDTPNRLFVKKEDLTNIKAENLESFVNETKLNVGTVLGYQYDDEIEALMKKPAFESRFERANDAQANISKLMNGRIDGFIMEQLLGNYFIKKNNLQDKIGFYDFAFGFDLNRQAYLMISKKADPTGEITNKISKAVEEVKNTEEYKNILKQYF